MILDMPFTVVEDRGSVYFDTFSDNAMFINANKGDITNTLDRDKLYEVRGSLGAWQFRFGSCAFLYGTNTYIYNVQWNNGIRPQSQGLYNFRVLASERKEIFGRTFCMIGDSITWWERGGAFRNKLRLAGLKYDFAGRHTDPWGYRHEGNGGFNTDQTLAISSGLPLADTYFILLGTNDRIPAIETFDNLINLINILKTKDYCCKVYICTLLKRDDQFNIRNNEVNTLLRAATLPHKVKLIDANLATVGLNDGLHPTDAGYQSLVNHIISDLK